MANRTSINGPTRNPFGVSFIQTASGATITGEIKRYLTYQEMVSDPAPARLATVANGSHDDPEVYTVPEEHIGGVLYQRDFVTNTWVLLYTEKSLAVPTYIEWNYILNVPPWVGGVTHNRKKLIEDTVAELRTTYYSFDNFKLIIPPASTKGVELGEEIVLEQYSGYGAIIIPYEDGDITTTTAEIITDNDTGKTYQVIYTYAPATATDLGDDEHSLLLNGHAYVFHLICTEDDDGLRYWSLITTGDQACDMAQELHKEHTDHLLDPNPHNQYLRRVELGKYITAATPDIPGYIRLAVETDLGGDNNTKAITPYLLTQYVSQSLTVDSDLWKEYVDNKFSILRNDLDNHINNTDIHVTVEDKRRWNSYVQIAHDSNDMSYHLNDPLAHYDLFAAKADLNHNHIPSEKEQANLAVNTHNDSEIAHSALFAKKQDKLIPGTGIQFVNGTNGITVNCTITPVAPSEPSEPQPDNDTTYSPGTYINITDSNVINNTLAAGKYVTISLPVKTKTVDGEIVEVEDENGNPVYVEELADTPHLISVKEATTEEKGVTQLTAEINDENHLSADVAVTPVALAGFFSLYEHVFDNLGALETLGSVQYRQSSTNGWIKFPSMMSSTFEGKCLAMAWGVSPYYYGTEGDLIFNLELEGCCKFYRIIYPILNLVPVNETIVKNTPYYDFNGVFKLASKNYTYKATACNITTQLLENGSYGIPTTDDDGNDDIKAISKLKLYVQAFASGSRCFKLSWIIFGYVDAYSNEVWHSKPQLVVNYSGASAKVNNSTYDFSKDLAFNHISPAGWKHSVGNYGDHAVGSAALTWTIQREEGDEDPTLNKVYKISNAGIIVVAKALRNTPSWSKIYVNLDGATINMRTKTISGITIEWVGQKLGTTEVNKTIHEIDFSSATLGTAYKLFDFKPICEPKTRWTRGYFYLSYYKGAIQIKVGVQCYSQHDSSAYRFSYAPEDMITLKYE